MKRFIQGEGRTQATLLPELLDDYIADTNPVRVVDVFVDELDLGELGFSGVEPAATGRPAYHPADLLKLYIYGYLNRIQSSRRLEREAQRNVELMWLTGRLMPDFKTIANFRKDNGPAIRKLTGRDQVMADSQFDSEKQAHQHGLEVMRLVTITPGSITAETPAGIPAFGNDEVLDLEVEDIEYLTSAMQALNGMLDQYEDVVDAKGKKTGERIKKQKHKFNF